MNPLQVVQSFVVRRSVESVLSISVLALALAALTFVVEVNSQVTARLRRDVNGVDMVVGAKGGGLQLVLSGVYLVDPPSGNIPWEAVERLSSEPMVQAAIPLALGDNFGGFPIVGTDWQYVNHFGGELASGARWTDPMQVVVGADVAQMTGLAVGSDIVSNHGIGDSVSVHRGAPYRVVGVLGRTGSVLDRVVVTSLESVWSIHEPRTLQPGSVLPKHHDVTVVLVRFKTPLAAAFLPRQINEGTNWQAASPAFEFTRLFSVIGLSSTILFAFGVVLLALAIATSFVALHVVTREHLADFAIIRMLGASPAKTTGLIFLLAIALGVPGIVLGIVAGEGAVWWLSKALVDTRSITVNWWTCPPELLVIPSAGVLSVVLAAALPCIRVYRLDVLEVLQSD